MKLGTRSGSGLLAMQAKNNLKTPPIVCYTNGFRLHNPDLPGNSNSHAVYNLAVSTQKSPAAVRQISIIFIYLSSHLVYTNTRARAESVYNISTPLLFRLLAGTWGGGCLIETSNCSVGSSLPIYLCTQCRAEIITQHLRYSGSLVSIFLPAACQHQRDHEKIRNLRAPMRDLGMIKRLLLQGQADYSSVSMVVVPLYVQQKIFLYRVAGNRALQGIRGVGVVIGNSL